MGHRKKKKTCKVYLLPPLPRYLTVQAETDFYDNGYKRCNMCENVS
jgi:hypothetical protein